MGEKVARNRRKRRSVTGSRTPREDRVSGSKGWSGEQSRVQEDGGQQRWTGQPARPQPPRGESNPGLANLSRFRRWESNGLGGNYSPLPL